jgi:hypothetical protein
METVYKANDNALICVKKYPVVLCPGTYSDTDFRLQFNSFSTKTLC